MHSNYEQDERFPYSNDMVNYREMIMIIKSNDKVNYIYYIA